MKMKILKVVVVLLIALPVFMSQTSDPETENLGIDTSQQMMKEVSVSRFEDPALWYVSMSQDEGYIQRRRLEGSAPDKQPIPDEEDLNIEEMDKYVLGVKVQFIKRGVNKFYILASKPIPIEGITKTVSVHVVGRNFNHELILVIKDYQGKLNEISMGKLNFLGWKKLTVAIPSRIKQEDYHFTQKTGIQIVGFRIDCDPAEAYGTYYIYFDDMRAVTDLYGELIRDENDMIDSW